MKERGIKTHLLRGMGSDHGLRICGSYHKIVGIFKTMAVSIYNGIDQIKSTIIVSKVWRPDAAGSVHSLYVKFSLICKSIGKDLPVYQIF